MGDSWPHTGFYPITTQEEFNDRVVRLLRSLITMQTIMGASVDFGRTDLTRRLDRAMSARLWELDDYAAIPYWPDTQPGENNAPHDE